MDTSESISSNLCINPLRTTSLNSLKTLMQLVGTSIGPFGKLKLLQHKTGGCVTVTSSSQRLFFQLSVKNIISKVVVSASKTQLKIYNDAGLYCSLLILKLINNSVSCEYPLSLVGVVYDYFSELFFDCLNSDLNHCVIKVNFSNLHHLKSLVLTLLSSKPGCILSTLDKNHLCCLILEAIFGCITNTSSLSGAIHLLTSDGICPSQSKLFKGTLIPISKSDQNYLCNGKWKVSDPNCVKVILFTMSLSGDLDFPVDNLELKGGSSVLEMSVNFLERRIHELICDEVDIVFCQKVIHPRLKKQLQDSGVLVLERLGGENAQNLVQVLGGVSNSSIVGTFSYTFISFVRVESIGKNSFCIFNSKQFPSYSLVLGNYNAEAVTELKITCQQVISSLFHLLKYGKVCYGGGCLEIYTIHLLKKKIAENLDDIKNSTECTLGQLQFSFETFARSLADVCCSIQKGTFLEFATENVHGHFWRLQNDEFPTSDNSCVCGLCSCSNIKPTSWIHLSDLVRFPPLDKEHSLLTPEIQLSNTSVLLDEFSCKLNAMTIAFETASLLLRTTVFVNNGV